MSDLSPTLPSNQVGALHSAQPVECGDSSPLSKNLSTATKPPWPHAPVRKLSEHGIYMVTAGTFQKQHLFHDAARLDLMLEKLMRLSSQYHWQLEAWAVFPNHYHLVARGNPDSGSLRKFITHLHADSARELNRIDGAEGRRVWFNFWDSRLTFEKSYLARLNYVHQNAVRHGVVPLANQYGWCSAAWFERVTTPAMVQTIYSFKADKLEVPDDF